jgi:hypothetical protein
VDEIVRDTPRNAAIVLTKRTAGGLLALALFMGFVVGRLVSTDGAAHAEVLRSDATPSAVVSEQTVVCVSPSPTMEPSPTATPTPVPPVAVGTAVNAADDWTVVVTGITLAPTIEGIQPKGKFLRLNATVTNNSSEVRTYPFSDWILVDEMGRTFAVKGDATTTISGSGWYRGVDTSLPTDFGIIFDVAADAGPAFTLESRTDPTLRVALQVQVLG